MMCDKQFTYTGAIPVNTRRRPNVELMLGRRLRRRANIHSTLGRRLVFAGVFPNSGPTRSDHLFKLQCGIPIQARDIDLVLLLDQHPSIINIIGFDINSACGVIKTNNICFVMP